MQLVSTITIQDVLDIHQFVEIIVHTLYHHHRLLVTEDSESLILNALRCHFNLWELAYLIQFWSIRRGILTRSRYYLNLRVKLSEKACHHIVKAIEHAEHDDKCHRGYGNAHNGYK